MRPTSSASLRRLLQEVVGCTLCAEHLPLGPRPVLQVSHTAKVLIVGQAPGRKVHETGVPFNDPSGVRLRQWLGLSPEVFYDPARVAILPMGFCFPGTGKSGDLPPRTECAETWRARLLGHLKAVEFTVVLGKYAMDYHLSRPCSSVGDAVSAWEETWPRLVPLPHPSPRNQRWFQARPWFEEALVPRVRRRVAEVLQL